MKRHEISTLPLDDQFARLLHIKLINKTGACKRQAKKYYTDIYKRSGIIPKPLRLAAQGIMEGRKCSGRPRVLEHKVIKRFVQMVKASSDPDDAAFIFITRRARTIKNYHKWLEEEFGQKISLAALRRCVKEENLKIYLLKPDFEQEPNLSTYFNPEDIFDLIQIDGCVFSYLKIRDPRGEWKKPQVIEFYDTGSRYMFILDLYFSESSKNSVDLFSKFLLSTPFPEKKIRLRPDQAKGFLNLKRVIHELNIKFSMPQGFFMKPDFSRSRAPKDKVHLESSHRSLHNFEIRIIKKFEDKIVKTKAGYIFKNGKKEQITVTYLDIDLEQLKKSGLVEVYRKEHNMNTHYFSVEGKTTSWVPQQRLDRFLSAIRTIEFTPADVQGFMKYGFDKIAATVSTQATITYKNHKYYVALGAEKFSRHRSTKVQISDVNEKLLIFDAKNDGIFLGEALPLKATKKAKNKSEPKLPANEVEQIAQFLESTGMRVDIASLIESCRQGLTLAIAKSICERNKARYDNYCLKLKHSKQKSAIALFNAFIIDYQRHQPKTQVAPYAALGEHKK
jgi:hypothetical protein